MPEVPVSDRRVRIAISLARTCTNKLRQRTTPSFCPVKPGYHYAALAGLALD